MKYKLKTKHGKATFLLRTGKDLVKNEMAAASAQHIIDNGKITEASLEGYPICIDDKWFFEGEPSGEISKQEYSHSKPKEVAE